MPSKASEAPNCKSDCQHTRSDEVAGWSGRQRGSGATGAPAMCAGYRQSRQHALTCSGQELDSDHDATKSKQVEFDKTVISY